MRSGSRSTVATSGNTGGLASRPRTSRTVAQELTILVAMWGIYEGARLFRAHASATALRNGYDVIDIEHRLHLPREQSVQDLLLHNDTVVQAANYFYMYVHLPLTAGALIWLFVKRREYYRRIRNALIAASACALVIYLALPVAPPRKLPNEGFVDTAVKFGQSVYGNGGGESKIADEYAAMPSLHVGWALLIAIGLISASKTRWRWLWLLHPIVTLLVVVGTANHYWLDGLAGMAIVLIAYEVFPGKPAAVAADGSASVVVLPTDALPDPAEAPSGADPQSV